MSRILSPANPLNPQPLLFLLSSSSFPSFAGRRRLEDSEESDPLPAVVPCDAVLLRGAYVLHLYFGPSVCV
jgi:hypothetical protein